MMECEGDSGGLEDLVDLATDVTDSSSTIRDAAERLLTLLGVDEDPEDLLSSSEDEGVELDVDELDDDDDDEGNAKLLHQLAASLAKELKQSCQKPRRTTPFTKDPFDRDQMELTGYLDHGCLQESNFKGTTTCYRDDSLQEANFKGTTCYHEDSLQEANFKGTAAYHRNNNLQEADFKGTTTCYHDDGLKQADFKGTTTCYRDDDLQEANFKGTAAYHRNNNLQEADLKRITTWYRDNGLPDKRHRQETSLPRSFGKQHPLGRPRMPREANEEVGSTGEQVSTSWNAGWDACAAEAVRYLVEDEGLPPHHPTVLAMKEHLEAQRERALARYTA